MILPMILKMILKPFDFQCDFDFEFQITTSKMIWILILNHLYSGDLIFILKSSTYDEFAHLWSFATFTPVSVGHHLDTCIGDTCVAILLDRIGIAKNTPSRVSRIVSPIPSFIGIADSSDTDIFCAKCIFWLERVYK